MQKADVPSSPIILAVILGPMAESNLRRAVLMYEGSYSFLWTRPIGVVFLVLAALSCIHPTGGPMPHRGRGREEKENGS